MDIELARTFLEITRCGSLAAAAEKLHVTQTAITARVKNLETHIGQCTDHHRTGPERQDFRLYRKRSGRLYQHLYQR